MASNGNGNGNDVNLGALVGRSCVLVTGASGEAVAHGRKWVWDCPPTPSFPWHSRPEFSQAPGPLFEGSRIVVSSTPVRFSVPYRSPGQAHIENLPHVRRGQCNNL
jgi:hypothetical protein